MNASTSDSVPCGSPQLWRKPIFWAIVGLVVLLSVFGFFWLKKVLSPPPPVVIASFPAEFSDDAPQPPWRYLWNATGMLGNADDYQDLKWNGHIYVAGTGPKYPAPAPASYLRLSGGSGHTGQGSTQGRSVGSTFDRFLIVAYAVPKRGNYWLTQTGIRRHAGPKNGSVEVRVLVNDRPIGLPFDCQSEEKAPFDRELGRLGAGDTIYVAVGPNGSDRDDSFDLQFSIAARPR